MDSNPHNPSPVGGGMERRAQILRFLWRYRNSGVFSGLSLEPFLEHRSEPEGSPEEFSRDLEALGPTFVKLGQMLSTRPDIVPPAYATALERMQENVGGIPFEQVREVVEGELGVRLSKAFGQFDPEPVGCASLAQVHRATLRDGTPVAVKVQKPGIGSQLAADLSLLRGVANAADRITKLGRHVHFADWLGEFNRTLMAELDYVAEAQNLERFGEHLAPYPELCVPYPVWDLTSRRVLTMQLLEGTRVDQVPGVRRTEQPMQPLADALMRGYLDQMFVHGEIHADPHPGNLRVTGDGRLAIFDLGMVANVPPRQRERMLKLLFAAVDGRGEQVAQEAIALGTPLDDYDDEHFTREVGQLVARYAAHSASMSEGRVVLELVRLATAHGLRTPPEVSLLGKTLLNLDAVCQFAGAGIRCQTGGRKPSAARHARAPAPVALLTEPGQRTDGVAVADARWPAQSHRHTRPGRRQSPAAARDRSGGVAPDGKPAEDRQPHRRRRGYRRADPGFRADDAHTYPKHAMGLPHHGAVAVPAGRRPGCQYRGQCTIWRPQGEGEVEAAWVRRRSDVSRETTSMDR